MFNFLISSVFIMLNRYLVIVFVMLFSVSVSHAYEPSKQEKANADYGAYPKNSLYMTKTNHIENHF